MSELIKVADWSGTARATVVLSMVSAGIPTTHGAERLMTILFGRYGWPRTLKGSRFSRSVIPPPRQIGWERRCPFRTG
jgi:hypothetical protein